MNQQIQKKADPLFRIKYLAYAQSQLVSRGDFNDFVRWAKFQLCMVTRRLTKDPIWDLYTPEEILIEYYSHQFEKNKKFLLEFEMSLNSVNGVVDDFSAWADKQIEKSRKEREELEATLEHSVSFSPTDVLGD